MKKIYIINYLVEKNCTEINTCYSPIDIVGKWAIQFIYAINTVNADWSMCEEISRWIFLHTAICAAGATNSIIAEPNLTFGSRFLRHRRACDWSRV